MPLLTALVLATAMTKTDEITFKGATDLTLSGELMLPEGNGPFAAVLLLPGSGPTDRDGNQLPTYRIDSLKQIAEHLAKSGIATFRFDKRPVARYLAHWPIDSMEKMSEYFSFENHVADVAAAFETMTKAKGIDAKRCGILGHSEGGLFTAWQAPRLKPKAIVLAATAGDTMVSVLRFQIGRNLAQPSVPEQLRKDITAANEEAMSSIIKDGKLPERVHPNLATLYNPSALKLLRSYLTIDPTAPLREYKGPVLVINGEKDLQVRASVDAPRLYEALKSRDKSVQDLFIVPNASHNFKESRSDTDHAFEGQIVPAMLDKLTSWLKANLV